MPTEEQQSGLYKLVLKGSRPNNPTEMVDYIIYTGIKQGASDIHIGANRFPDGSITYWVRLRIYGKLHIVNSDFAQGRFREMIARLKVLASLDTTEISMPQDGQIPLLLGSETIVLRVSIIPSGDFEEVVMRIQRSDDDLMQLDQLRMTTRMLGRVKKLIIQRSGLIILNGPAGSGKTTTIYAMMGALANPEKKILTLEDPIETRIPFVSHLQVSARTSFATLARAFMRQDADVIFLGEIRDEESATSAVQLAQTGHLTLTTLHTRNAIGVISRMEAFNMHPNFIASSLIASLGQRLAPHLCDSCKIEYQQDETTLEKINKICPIPKDAKFFRQGPGCEKCIHGIIGRIAIFELFMTDPEISEMINRKESLNDILQVAKLKGMETFPEEALYRVYAGLTDLQFVQNIVFTPGYS